MTAPHDPAEADRATVNRDLALLGLAFLIIVVLAAVWLRPSHAGVTAPWITVLPAVAWQADCMVPGMTAAEAAECLMDADMAEETMVGPPLPARKPVWCNGRLVLWCEERR